MNKGYSIFALINKGECLGRKHKYPLYKTFRPSKKCVNGEGAIGAMNVYSLTGSFILSKVYLFYPLVIPVSPLSSPNNPSLKKTSYYRRDVY